jgi:hypothetical protein
VSGPPPEGRDGEGGPSRATVAALIAIVILALFGYWAFTAIEHMRKLQNCLAEGRRDCLQLESSGK